MQLLLRLLRWQYLLLLRLLLSLLLLLLLLHLKEVLLLQHWGWSVGPTAATPRRCKPTRREVPAAPSTTG